MASNMNYVMEQLRQMKKEELHASTEILSCLVASMAKNCGDLFTRLNQCEILTYNGDCLFENHEFQRAEATYRKALQVFKTISRSKPKQIIPEFLKDVVSDAAIKYKVYRCCLRLKNDDGAIHILESISQKNSTSKVKVGLARLYHKRGEERRAVVLYKEALKSNPLALDCAKELLKLGEHPNVIISMMNVSCNLDWLTSYVKAHGFAASRDYNKSVIAFEALNKRVCLSGNADLLCDLAHAAYMSGSLTTILHLKAANLQDPLMLRGADLHSFLLCKDELHQELETFSNKIFLVSELHPEPWVAVGYHAKFKADYTKAVYLATRASELDSGNVQALLLKGSSLRMLGETKVAISHFRQAIKLAPHRLDCYSELVETYMQDNRQPEALSVARNVIDVIGVKPSTLVLCAGTMVNDSNLHPQAIKLVEKALSIDPLHQSSTVIRIIIAKKQEKFEEAIQLLTSAVRRHCSSKLHLLLAQCYLRTSKLSDAFDHFNLALSIDPKCQKAKDGLESIQRSEVVGGESGEQEERGAMEVAWPHDASWD